VGRTARARARAEGREAYSSESSVVMSSDATHTNADSGVQDCTSESCAPKRLLSPDREAVFWSRTKRDGECLIWTAAKTGRGYGSFRVSGRNTPAHRVAFLLVNGEIPTGLVVRHSCDRTSCVEPSHLLVGTQVDNMRDKYERGRARHIRGSDCHLSKLTESNVLTIRLMRATGVAPSDLAQRFSISSTQIVALAAGRYWSHVGGPLTVPAPDPARVEALRRSVSLRPRRGEKSRSDHAADAVLSRGMPVRAAAIEFGISHQAVRSALAKRRS
jgi:HNH endonuclease